MKPLLVGIGIGIGFFGACLAVGEIAYRMIKDDPALDWEAA